MEDNTSSIEGNAITIVERGISSDIWFDDILVSFFWEWDGEERILILFKMRDIGFDSNDKKYNIWCEITTSKERSLDIRLMI